jgi:DNA-directed RNA polymerase
MSPILESLNFLGNTPWRINKNVYDVVIEAWKEGIIIGELPSQVDLEPPKAEDCWRIPQRRKNYIPKTPPEQTDAGDNKEPNLINGMTEDEYFSTPRFDQRYYEEMCRRVRQKNAELHSLRCDMKIKLWVAEKFKDDNIYFPYSLDFRGRAYPVPPNLNHIGSDLCRGLLKFEKAKPLGKTGLRWLKIHMANLFGFNKASHDDRVLWVDSRIADIEDSADNPLSGRRWCVTINFFLAHESSEIQIMRDLNITIIINFAFNT